ncbi:MAG TPA: XamI family restriction endonuclease [Thermoanaerobaculia bacterium]|nr:XamI family restriction endonuclease [Thermoanaerobaculia bacterium]
MSPDRKYIDPPRWTAEEFEADRQTSIKEFRDRRITEPLEDYLERFEAAQDVFETLVEQTVDLTQIYAQAFDILTDPKLVDAFRYLASPPISLDDLRLVADGTLSRKQLKADPEMAKRFVDSVTAGLDRKRFPWVTENREPNETERDSAILASAVLMATQKVATARRNLSKAEQEEKVRQALLDNNFKEVPRKDARQLSDAPAAGEFCMESLLGPRKADVIVGLWDGRKMPIECKVSNSYVNSIKRLNNDAAVKAQEWLKKLGENGVVPAAVVSGAFKLRHLQKAQNEGLTIFWGHNLPALIQWIEDTRS